MPARRTLQTWSCLERNLAATNWNIDNASCRAGIALAGLDARWRRRATYGVRRPRARARVIRARHVTVRGTPPHF
eukprot:130526-Lingulodinium_polyedra.AAC.1